MNAPASLKPDFSKLHAMNKAFERMVDATIARDDAAYRAARDAFNRAKAAPAEVSHG